MLSVDAARGGIIVYHAMDVGAYAADPRPNSAAAAANFAAAANAIGTSNVIDLESATLGGINNRTVAPGVTLDGTDHNGADQTIRDTPNHFETKWYGYNTTAGGVKFVAINGGYVTFTFAQPVQAFGAYLTGMQTFGATRNFSFNDGSPQVLEVPNPNSDGGALFFGFTDQGKSISSVTINMPGDYVSLDDVCFAFVPEPSGLIFLVAGLHALRRRKRNEGA